MLKPSGVYVMEAGGRVARVLATSCYKAGPERPLPRGWGGSPGVGFLAKNWSFSLQESLVCVCVQGQGAAASQLRTSKVGEQAV